jgi:threonine dehydratase
MSNDVPNQVELTAAHAIVAQHHPRTPLYRLDPGAYPGAGEVYVKYESHGPVRSFKARGALYSLWRLSSTQRAGGVVTASTGNHGRGVAYAGSVFGIPVTVVVPSSTPSVKIKPIERLGADLRIVEGDLLQAVETARSIADTEKKQYLEDGEDAGLMAGASTVATEILEDLPDVTTIVVPVGGGNLIAAITLRAKTTAPRVRVIGVQSEAAPSVTRSWEAGVVTRASCATFAGGLATSNPGRLAFEVIKQQVDEMILVSEESLRTQIVHILQSTGEIAEGAGAAAFAALAEHERSWQGKTVLVLTGGNIELADLKQLLADDKVGSKA